MSTMQLQEKLVDDFNSHRIVVNKSYSHVQKNGVLKVEFKYQMSEMKREIKRVKKLANSAMRSANSKKDKTKNNATTTT